MDGAVHPKAVAISYSKGDQSTPECGSSRPRNDLRSLLSRLVATVEFTRLESRLGVKGAENIMSHDNYWTRRYRRRTALKGAGLGIAGVGAAALVGCGDDDDNGGSDSNPTSSSGGSTAPASATAKPAAAKPGGVWISQSANVYETIDPHRTVASPVLQVLGGVQSKILRFTDPNTGDLTGDLAEKWESPDPTTVVLHLRQGVKWHDKGPGAANPAAASGRALTTDDILYNINRQKAGLLADGTKGAFGRKSYWSKVDSIQVAANTITLKLKAPDATFIQGLANEFNQIVQKELIEAVEPKATEISADKVIGTGPYILTEWVPGKTISAVKNPGYFLKDKPYFEAMRWVQTFEDPTAYRIAFEQKQIDSFSDPSPDTTVAIYNANKNSTALRYSGTANTVAIYLPRTQAPWTDDRLIKAINLAADRRQIIQQLHSGLGKVSGPVSWLQEKWAIDQKTLETTPGYRLKKDEDLKEAKALWDAASGSTVGDITWVVPDTWASRAGWGSTPEILTAMFNKAFGTTQFKGKTANYSQIIPAWQSKKFDPFFGWIPNVEIPDARADLVAALSSTSPGNFWGINEPEKIDAKLQKALTLLDEKEALKLVNEVQNLVLENGQYGRIIMYNYISPTLRWKYLHDTGPSDDEGWNFLASSLAPLETWIDTADPSASGRSTPTYKGL